MNGLAIAAPAQPPLPATDKPKRSKERLYTVEEYLEMEELSLTNHEFHNGKLIPMAGGTKLHSQIKARFITALNNALDAHDALLLVYNSDIRIGIPSLGRYLMPDAAVAPTGNGDPIPGSPVGVLTNPILLVEVVSSDSESYDRGAKFTHYRSLPSFEEYVLVSQNEPHVETFVKKDGKWFLNEDAFGLEAAVEFVSLGVKIALSEIYRKVSFEEEKPKKKRKAG